MKPIPFDSESCPPVQEVVIYAKRIDFGNMAKDLTLHWRAQFCFERCRIHILAGASVSPMTSYLIFLACIIRSSMEASDSSIVVVTAIQTSAKADS
ncbi:hypothetical protein Y032_0858g2724 [Ancylostoma ceylanicum]|uniref:Uncharacterized protein n=1 Tax=Ancylostoma ceylanicum TaxID=53326 RepID=A0A016WAW2_9BILA|nr:hypothetical protein Y032_0858g2724 [Ancylostoma ceylanicum]